MFPWQRAAARPKLGLRQLPAQFANSVCTIGAGCVYNRNMTKTDTPAAHDRYGFPLIPCRRCSGTGQFGPSSVDGGRCFKCGGSGWSYASKKVANARVALAEAFRAARRPTMGKLLPGDMVRRDSSEERREVAAISVDRTICDGWSKVGKPCGEPDPNGGPVVTRRDRATGELETWQEVAWACTVTFTDGTQITGSTAMQIFRAATIDPAPYLAQAGVTR